MGKDRAAAAAVRKLRDALPFVPPVTDIAMTAWGQDPLVRGSYSDVCGTVAADEVEGVLEAARAPLGRGLISFAGEA